MRRLTTWKLAALLACGVLLFGFVGAFDPAANPNAVDAGAGAFGHARRVAAPAADEVVDRGARVVAAHPSPLGQRLGDLLDPLGGQRDRAETGEGDLLEQVAVAVVVSALCHAASSG